MKAGSINSYLRHKKDILESKKLLLVDGCILGDDMAGTVRGLPVVFLMPAKAYRLKSKEGNGTGRV